MNPNISIIIPTLNSEKVLTACLHSIRRQNYPQSKIKIIITDGGSTDRTLKIAKKYKAKIIKNKLKTAEAGKALGLKHSQSKYLVFIDSDNILPNKFYLSQMITALQSQPTAIGAEPLSFTYRPQSGFIERYSSLIGANDPYAFITGFSDKINHIDGQWTHLSIPQKNYQKYLLLTLNPKKPLPTIGANGVVFRRSFLQKQKVEKYFFDIDIISSSPKTLYFIKTKNSIIHSFCESSIKKFYRKQVRRLTDYYHYQSLRQFNWSTKQKKPIIKFIFHTFFLSLPFSLYGFYKKPDPAWFFHPLACWLSLFAYTQVTIKHYLGILKPLNRKQWQQ